MIIDFLVGTVKVWSGGQYVTTGLSLSGEKKERKTEKGKKTLKTATSVSST